MTTIDLIAKHIPESEKQDMSKLKIYPEKQCCVTGKITDCVDRKKLLGSSFTTQSILKAPDSQYAGINAMNTLKYRPERASSWIVSESEFKKLTRIEIRPLVLEKPPYKTWSGYATTSYKKHGSVLTPVNSGNRAIWVFEMLTVDCSNHDQVNTMYNELLSYLLKGFGRSILESCEIPAFLIAKFGIKECMQFETWARPIYQSNLYQFLCYLLPSQEDLKSFDKPEIIEEKKIPEKKGQIKLW